MRFLRIPLVYILLFFLMYGGQLAIPLYGDRLILPFSLTTHKVTYSKRKRRPKGCPQRSSSLCHTALLFSCVLVLFNQLIEGCLLHAL